MIYRIGFLALFLLSLWGCGVDNGEKLLFDNAVLYFSKKVPEAEARALGDYLNRNPFDQQYRYEFKLDKDGGSYIFMIGLTDEQYKNTSVVNRWKDYAVQAENGYFKGKPVNAVIGNEYFRWR